MRKAVDVGVAADQDQDYDLIIIGAGASGIGCGVMAKEFGVEPARTLIIERGSTVGSTFDQWPVEMKFITPSFNQQAFGFMDLNSVAFDTSPAQLLHVQHPTGSQYAEYLREVARIHALPVVCETNVTAVTPVGAGTDDGHGQDCMHAATNGFEVYVTHSPNAETTLPAKIRTKFVIWAAGEFQYPRDGGFPGAAEQALVPEPRLQQPRLLRLRAAVGVPPRRVDGPGPVRL